MNNLSQTTPNELYRAKTAHQCGIYSSAALGAAWVQLTGAGIGALAAPIDVNLDSPIVAHGGEWVGFDLKVLVGTATASQTLRGIIQVNGYFE